MAINAVNRLKGGSPPTPIVARWCDNRRDEPKLIQRQNIRIFTLYDQYYVLLARHNVKMLSSFSPIPFAAREPLTLAGLPPLTSADRITPSSLNSLVARRTTVSAHDCFGSISPRVG